MKNKKKLLKNPMKAISKEIKKSSPTVKFGLVAAIILLAIVIGAAVITALPIFGIHSSGVVAYGDIRLSVTSVDWGMVDAGSNASRQMTVTNVGNIPLNMHVYTTQWVPNSAPDYITITSDIEDQMLPVGQSKVITLYLYVKPEAAGVIIDFSNTITVQGLP